MLMVFVILASLTITFTLTQCPSNDYFYCVKARTCIHRRFECNAEDDCGNCEDESNCINKYYDPIEAGKHCNHYEFYCGGSKCISADKICDGVNDCGNCFDEVRCGTNVRVPTCKNGDFYCFHGSTCIPWELVCDGYNDCQDWDDEKRCNNVEWHVTSTKAKEISCMSPPPVENATPSKSYYEHGEYVVYQCNKFYKKSKVGAVKCHNGKWLGNTPQCKDTRCYVSKIQSTDGLSKIDEEFFENGQSFNPVCKKGYSLAPTKDPRIYCRDGEWTGQLSPCIEATCDSNVPKAENAIISKFQITHGGRVFYACNDPFVKIQNESVICRFGKWEGSPPICKNPRCYVSEIRLFAIEDPVKKIYENGESFTTSCIEGYSPIGGKNEVFRCINGEWVGNLLLLSYCKPASCNLDPPNVTNAEIVTIQREHGGQVVYECHENYKKMENETIVCHFGKWQGSKPICKDTRCYFSKIKSIAGLKEIEADIYESSQSFTPSCIEGYSLIPSDEGIRCENGLWIGHLSPCKPKKCEDSPPEIENGTIIEMDAEHGGKVVYLCDDYFKKVQEETITCYFGNWLGLTAKCKDTRCFFHSLETFYLIFHEKDIYESGESFIPSCKGFFQTNEGYITCNDGEWEGNLNPCKPRNCEEQPPEAKNAEIKEINTSNNGEVIYECNEHYIQVNQYASMVCFSGNWIGDLPICKDTRCYFSQLYTTFFQDSGKDVYYDQESFVPTCLEGLVLSREVNTSLVCDKGEWKGNLSPCKPASCLNDPPQIENGEIISFENYHTGEVIYSCNLYHKLAKPGKIICFYGIWIGSSPECKDSRCYTSDFNSVGINLNDIEKEIYETGEFLKLSCKEGYSFAFAEDDKLQCVDGEWVGHLEPCQPSSCQEDPPEIENGKIIDFSNEHGGKATYKCKKHFAKTQEETIICQYGKWQGLLPHCKDTRVYINS